MSEPAEVQLPQPAIWREVLLSLRLPQWIKNALVFAPIALGGKLGDASALMLAIVAFLAIGFAASGTYLVNDMLDAEDDRRHWSKRMRPIARGSLSFAMAGVAAAGLILAAMLLALSINGAAMAVLVVYIGVTLAYSLGLKRIPLVDGFVLAGLFTLRLALGVVTVDVPPSPWLFVFSMFLFSSLSYAKRYTELQRGAALAAGAAAGRGYRVEDQPLLLSVGMAAAIGSVIILILYIINDAYQQSFFGRTLWLWGFPPVVFLLICRIWIVTVRGGMNDDPVEFVVLDGASLALLAALLACFLLAWIAI